jgi:polyhydroxyalkanoate synthesis regulator phasin
LCRAKIHKVFSGCLPTILSIEELSTSSQWHSSATLKLRKKEGDIKMSSKKTIVAIAITTAALTVGSVGFANASPKSTTRVSTTKTSARVSAIINPITSTKGGPVSAVTSVLTALVTKGIITQAQADAIVTAVTAAQVAQREVEGSPKRVPHPDRAVIDKLVSDAIGVDTATIKSRLRAGESLATIAGAKKDVLIAALVAEATKRIDAAVTAGTLTAAQATSMKTTLVAKTTAQINETRGAGFSGAPKGKKGEREHGGMGDRDHGDMDDRDDAPTA